MSDATHCRRGGRRKTPDLWARSVCAVTHCFRRFWPHPPPSLIFRVPGFSKTDFLSLRRPLVRQELFELFYGAGLNSGKYVRQPSYGIDLPQAAYSRASFNCSTPSKSSFSCAGSEEINCSDLRPNTFGATNIFAGLMKSKYSLRRVVLHGRNGAQPQPVCRQKVLQRRVHRHSTQIFADALRCTPKRFFISNSERRKMTISGCESYQYCNFTSDCHLGIART